MLRIILLCCLFVACYAAFEGDPCVLRGQAGKCKSIKKCQSAIEDRKAGRRPELCGFVKSDPIVCCLDDLIMPATQRPPDRTTTEYVPPDIVYDLVDKTGKIGGCGPIPAATAQKTGQRAFDKCIEYQEKFIYPCESTGAISGAQGRGNHCYHNADELIIGGNVTSKHEFPHMVMVGYGDESVLEWHCGGSIISENFVLSAGHCIAHANLGDATYVLVGAYTRSDANKPDYRYKIQEIIPHPRYQSPIKYDDIALMRTEKSMKLSAYVVPACLHIGDEVDDSRVLATGWGLTQDRGSASEVMMKVILNKVTAKSCAQEFKTHKYYLLGINHHTQFCYGAKEGESKDTCQGDSGGPVQIKSKRIHCMYIITGVTSFGKDCGEEGGSAVYTKVNSYLPWIEDIVWPSA